MNVQDQLSAGIERIHRTGWGVDDDGMYHADAPACLLASLGTGYNDTLAARALARTIRQDCLPCVEKGLDDVMTVWYHNDDHMQSQEDALLILKKALHSVDGS